MYHPQLLQVYTMMRLHTGQEVKMLNQGMRFWKTSRKHERGEERRRQDGGEEMRDCNKKT